MASVRRHPNAKSRWQVRYRDPAGRQRTRSFAKKADADKYAAIVETDKLRGEWTDPRLGRITFAEWCRDYQATRLNLRRSTALRDEASFRNLILPHFGHLRLAGIQPVAVRQWVAALDGAGYAPATIRKAYQLLSAALEAAVKDGLLPRSPSRGVTLPRMERPEMRFLTPGEIGDLAAAIDPRYEALVLTAAYTGLRFGELGALRVDRLDMLKRSLRVVENLSEVQGHLAVGPVKSNASRRTVTMPAFLVDRLASHIATYPDESAVVFGAPEGGPIRRTNFRRRHWLPAVRSTVGESVRFHDLRHTHAALLIAEGIHPKVIQERLGHASIKTTLDTYGHLFEGLDAEAADALDDAFQRSHVDRMWTGPRSNVRSLH